MALLFKRVRSQSGIPVFQSVFENAQGGFLLDMDGLIPGEEIPAGSLFIYDEETRKATFVRTARVLETVNNGQIVKVEKNHTVIAGSEIEGVLVGNIDTTNAGFDVLNLASGISAEAGAIIASKSTENKNTGLLYESVTADINESVSITIRGTAYANRIPPVSKGQIPETIILSGSN